MRFLAISQLWIVGISGVLLGLVQAHPTLRGIAAHAAISATEFRWNLFFFWLAWWFVLGSMLRGSAHKEGLLLAVLAPLGYVSTGYAEHIVHEVTNLEIGLWASPLHLLSAGLLPAGLIVLILTANKFKSPNLRMSANLSLMAFSLAYLGLLWNFYQTAANEGWAWDWIETGPCWALIGLVWASHTWSRTPAPALVAYLAFLCLSRTALITSAHHLQSPQNNLALDLLSLQGTMAIKASFPGWEGLGFEGTLRSDKFRCAASVGIVLMFLLSRDLRGVNPQSRPGSQKAKVRGFSHFFTPGLGLLLVIGLGPSWTVWGVILLYSAAKASPAILRLHSGFFVFFFAGVSIIWCLLCFVDPSCPIFLPPEALALDPVSSRVGQHVSYHSGLAIACWFTSGYLMKRK